MKEKETNVWAWLGGIIGSIVATAIIIALWAFIVQWFWNRIMPDFGLPFLSFWQSSWLLFLLLILFFLPLVYFVKVAIKTAIEDLSGKTQINITSNYDVDDIAELAEIWKGTDFGHEVGEVDMKDYISHDHGRVKE